jgi:MOSC domain-containing protein YiiM
MTGTLAGIFASPTGGISKPALSRARVRAGYGVEGDASARHRRTPDRALCLCDERLYAELAREGVSLKEGDLAENFLLRGVDFDGIRPGDVFRVGADVEIEISMVRTPCKTLTALDPRLPACIVGRSGFLAYARKGGAVQVGDAVERIVRAERR